MQDEIGQVAARVRELRQLCGIPAAVMAAELGLEPAAYEALESGREDIPVGILMRVAQRCKVEPALLITGEEPRLHTYCLTRKGTGASVQRKAEYQYEALAAHFIRKRAEPFLVTVPPGGPLHLNSHPGQEFNYMLEGRLMVSVAGHELTLETGDSLYFDSNAAHGMVALDGKPARFLAFIV
jgi:quercetin dioxygenase-like cupin family protein/DNA-binding XRE family transcriptional regulator